MKKITMFSGLAISLFLMVLSSALIAPVSEAKYVKPPTEVNCPGHAILGEPPKVLKAPIITQLSNGSLKLEAIYQWTYLSDNNTGICKVLNSVNTVNTTIVGGTIPQADNSVASYGTFVEKTMDNKGGFKGTFNGFAVPYSANGAPAGTMKSQSFGNGKGFGTLAGYTATVYEVTTGIDNVPSTDFFTVTIKYTGDHEDS